MRNTQDWISVGALGDAFGPGANLLPQSQGLAGKTLTLHLDNGEQIEIRFSGVQTLTWKRSNAALADASANDDSAIPYSNTEIRRGVYFVDLIDPRQRAGTATFVLDVNHGICTVLFGQLPSEAQAHEPLLRRIVLRQELTSVIAKFHSGTIDTPFLPSVQQHLPTTELIGNRIEYTYSPTERYEHVYLNERLYSWHCLAGSEQGLADTDCCHYLRLAPLLYLFVWREKLVPTLGVVAVDLEQMKTTGKILGYRDFDFGAVVNFPVGARARVLSST